MERDIRRILTNNKSDFRRVIEDDERQSVAYKISNKKGNVNIYFTDLGEESSHKFSIRKDEERYKIKFGCKLDDSKHIPDVKDDLYSIRDNMLPNSNASVSQDYPSRSVKMEDYLTEEEAKMLF